MSTPAVEVDSLVVTYGATRAVDGISFTAPQGRITAVLGPNGAGKSSVLNAVCTVTRPTNGAVRVFGYDTVTSAVEARRRIGVVFQESTLDPDMSVERNLRFHARLYGMSRQRTGRRLAEVLDGLGLWDRRKDRVDQLSGGLARRVEIARALMHDPGLLILDEPTTGLDPESRRRLWDELVASVADRQVSVLYSTHYMDEAEHADQIIIVNEGRVVRQGTPASLKAELGASTVRLSTHDDHTALRNLIRAGFMASMDADGLSVGTPEPEAAIGMLVSVAGVPVRSVSVRHPSLDDVYLAATVAPTGATRAEVGR